MSRDLMHPVYLPFREDQLRGHFVAVAGEPRADPQKHLAYYRQSIERAAAYLERPEGLPADVRRARQIEKDERFWVVASLMALYHGGNRETAFSQLLEAAGLRPPAGHVDWMAALDGHLQLAFEVGLSSPRTYREYLRSQLDERTPIPYAREAAARAGLRLEGATQVDAILINASNGVGVLFEGKVLSDCSATVTYDVLRNQLARNIDVMLDGQGHLPPPLSARDPDLSCFVLLTPELFRRRPRSRLYGWLLNEYRERPAALGEDLPHRTADWPTVSQRLGWATFEDCKRIQPTACHWLPEPG
jgi:hypothetical protein